MEPALDASPLAPNAASTAAHSLVTADPTHPVVSGSLAPVGGSAVPVGGAAVPVGGSAVPVGEVLPPVDDLPAVDVLPRAEVAAAAPLVPAVAMTTLLVQAASATSAASARPAAAPVAVVPPAPLAPPVTAEGFAEPLEPAEPQRGLDDLYDIGRLAARLGVEHATIRVWLSRKVPWLPAPDGRLNGGAVWRATTLTGIEERRVPGRPGRKRQTIAPPG
ncbi:hypothetical protein [Cellulomonas fimi]|uniref:Uncharacterized protein n=1 Tax=Cellulomonas fimi TaxID=1708 RepID=A0A7Y0QHP2_CELFI|nr:hypothetical protein [Cellulomonas fimi]NMR20373.1 hypothetical protein [Cellulomonas fimi]